MSQSYKFVGALTFEEYLECHQVLAAGRRNFLRIASVIVGAAMIFRGLSKTGVGQVDSLVLFGAFLVLYGVVISPVQFRARVRRNWEQYPKAQGPMDVTVSSDGVRVTDDSGNPAHTVWSGFHRFSESKSLFMLYYSPLLPLCLPKRLLPSDQVDECRTLLASKIGSKEHHELAKESDDVG